MLVNMTPKDFMTFVLIYLLDKINNSEEVRPNDEETNELINSISVIRSHLTRHYLNTEISERITYSRMRDAFDRNDYSRRYTINIFDKLTESEEILKESVDTPIQEDFFMIKDIVKDAVRQVKKREIKKTFPLTDEGLEKIVENSIKYIKSKKE